MAPLSTVDVKDQIEKFKEAVRTLAQVTGPINCMEDLIAILSKTEPQHVIARLSQTLMKDIFKTLIVNKKVDDTDNSIPRKRVRADAVPEPAKQPPQLSKNFVRKPPPPLEVLVESNQKRNEAIEALNPPQPSMTPGLLQTIQLAQLASVLTQSEAKAIFRSVASNL